MTVGLWHVFRREVTALFLSPVAYIVMVVFLTATGFLTFTAFFLEGRADLSSFFELVPITLGLVVPAVTMRLFAEEYASGSFETLMTLPVTTIDVVLGKFLAALGFVVAMVAPTLLYAVMVTRFGRLDWGPVAGGYVAIVLLAGLYCAIGTLASAITRNQIVAFIIGVAITAFLALVDRMLVLLPARLTGLIDAFAIAGRFDNIARGVIDSRDLIFFVTFQAVVVAIAYRLIETRRWR